MVTGSALLKCPKIYGEALPVDERRKPSLQPVAPSYKLHSLHHPTAGSSGVAFMLIMSEQFISWALGLCCAISVWLVNFTSETCLSRKQNSTMIVPCFTFVPTENHVKMVWYDFRSCVFLCMSACSLSLCLPIFTFLRYRCYLCEAVSFLEKISCLVSERIRAKALF